MYRYITFFLGLVSALLLLYFWTYTPEPQIDTIKGFEKSLGIDRLGRDFLLETGADQKRFEAIAGSLGNNKSSDFAQIPKVLHFISIENLPLNEDEESCVSSWRQLHPNWEIKIWSPNEVMKAFGKNFYAFVFDSPKAIQRDLVTAQILIEEGGVAIDLDQECLRPIDDIAQLRSCFCGLEPPLFKPILKHRLHVSPTVVGASRGHIAIKNWMKVMLDRIYKMTLEQAKKMELLYYTVDAFGTAIDQSLHLDPQSVLVLGPTYFCPISPVHISEFEAVLSSESREGKLKKLISKIGLKKMVLFSWVQPESRSVSHSGGRLSEGQKKIAEKI